MSPEIPATIVTIAVAWLVGPKLLEYGRVHGKEAMRKRAALAGAAAVLLFIGGIALIVLAK